MTYNQFWYGDPWITKAYREAHQLSIERQNQMMHLQGLYIYTAVNAVVYNATKKKGARAEKYPDKPIRITPLSAAEKAEKAKVERQKIINQFTAWEKAFNKKNK